MPFSNILKMKFFDRIQFLLLRIIHSKLSEKIFVFSLLQVFIQALPLIIESIWLKLGYSTIPQTDNKS